MKAGYIWTLALPVQDMHGSLYLVCKCAMMVLLVLVACAGGGDLDQIAPGDHLIRVYTVCQ